mgnify:CR=1 FL=1
MSMENESIDDLIQQIASEHDVLLSKDDSIMILQTMKERLIQDSKAAQNVLLNQFKSQMEVISNGWSIEAKNHSDRILNSAVSSSKAEVARVMEDQSRVIIAQWKEELSTGFSEVIKTTQSSRQTAILNIIASFITLISAGIVFYVFLII